MSKANKKDVVDAIFRKMQHYMAAFKTLARFNKETMDWEKESRVEFLSLRNTWESWCRFHKLHQDVVKAFHWEIELYKLDLYMKNKFAVMKYDRVKGLAMLKSGDTQQEAARKLHFSAN